MGNDQIKIRRTGVERVRLVVIQTAIYVDAARLA